MVPKIDDKVLINNYGLYENLPDQIIGIVVRVHNGWMKPVCVNIPEYYNDASSKGYYYFTYEDIEVQNKSNQIKNKKENKNMKNKTLIKGYKVAMVAFADWNDTTILTQTGTTGIIPYACYDDLKKDDFVLCKTGHHGQVIGRIIQLVNEETDNNKVQHGREIICKIDYSNYIKRQERLEKLEKIKTQMAKKREELAEMAVYEALAKSSPEMAKLLEEFKELQ